MTRTGWKVLLTATVGLSSAAIAPARSDSRPSKAHPKELVGTWRVEVPPAYQANAVTWTLKDGGQFSMAAPTRKTSGTWEAEGGKLKVLTTSIDGKRLEKPRQEVSSYTFDKDGKLVLTNGTGKIVFLKQ